MLSLPALPSRGRANGKPDRRVQTRRRMTDKPINLRAVRKAKVRAEKEKAAEANRAAFGRTKADKLKAKAETAKAKAHVEAHKRETDRES